MPNSSFVKNGTEFVMGKVLKKGETTMDNSTIYTDGHGVKITDSTFYVHRQSYSLEGIKEIKLLKMPSSKTPGVLLFISGLILMILGSLNALSDVAYFSDTTTDIDADMAGIVAGLILVIAAILVSVMIKSKYAVKITTTEGEKRPLESKNKEYVANVVNSLKKAYYKYVRRRERHRV